MAVPKIAGLASGQHSFAHADANWVPLACTAHAERGFVKSCDPCVETAKATIEHARAVEADKDRA